jgi:pimeloyl-ACP methyl ester carboxylesterase
VQDKVYTTRDGDQLQYLLASGSKADATVVFLNGSFFNHHQWDLLFSRLSRKTREHGKNLDFLFLDYRGFGNVAPLSHPFTFDAIQGDVLDLLDKERIRGDLQLVGSSLGSLVGLSLLERAPGRFSSLVAYGFVTPVVTVVQHVREIFSKIKGQIEPILSRKGTERLDQATITPVAKAMWETFIVQYSRTAAAIKARGFTDAYATYLLKYMQGTPISTIGSFLDFFTNDALAESVATARFSPGTFQKVSVFHGTDDLITPFPDTKSFCDQVGIHEFKAFPNKGHTDLILDGVICDAIADAVLSHEPDKR